MRQLLVGLRQESPVCRLEKPRKKPAVRAARDGDPLSGLTAGVASPIEALRRVKDSVPDMPVLANTGVRPDNLREQLEVADGAVTGTAFKREGVIWNEVDIRRVREFMQIARQCR